MIFIRKLGRILSGTILVFVAITALGSTGCTVYSNGMTLPNPYYYKNRPQYFPTGPEFPFANEAASLQESERDSQRY